MIKLILKHLKTNTERNFEVNNNHVFVSSETMRKTQYSSEFSTDMEEVIRIINSNRTTCEVVSLEILL